MAEWQRSGPEPGKNYSDISYETTGGVAKVTIDRPEARNAFRPATPFDLPHAFGMARDVPAIGVMILTERTPDRRSPPPVATSPIA